MNSENYELRIGSEYRVCLPEDGMSVSGEFKGYVMIGNESAIVIRDGTGTPKIIPVSKILYMELLKSADEPARAKSSPEHLYG